MKLEDYLARIEGSEPGDWRVTQVPTFMYRLVPVRGSDNRTLDFEVQEHNVMLTYAPDVNLTMAWGLVADRNFSEEWSDKLPNKRAQAVILDFLFHGALVFRDTLVAVDGWRCILPQPMPGNGPPYKVPARRAKIARLIHRLCGPDTNFDNYFKRVGMAPVAQPWP